MTRASAALLLCAVLASAAAYVPAELADTARCDAAGLPDLAPFEQRLELGASPYGKSSSLRLFLPVYASARFADAGAPPNASVTAVVVFLHGLGGNANDYFCDGVQAVRAAGRAGGSTLVVAPWFGNEQVYDSAWGAGGDDSAISVYWTTSRWMGGGNISPGASKAAQFTTAFDCLDALVTRLSSRQLFPNVQIVTLVGFSAGAQLSSRYAFATPLGAPRDVGGSPRLRFIVSDPGSYLYLDDRRPAAACRVPRNTGPGATCADFEVPPEAPRVCPTYDDYKYGLALGSLSNLNLYLAPMDTNATLKGAAIERFAEKDVVYIFGTRDVCNCNLASFVNDAAVCFPAGGSKCAPTLAAGCCDTCGYRLPHSPAPSPPATPAHARKHALTPDCPCSFTPAFTGPSTNNALADGCASDVQGESFLALATLDSTHHTPAAVCGALAHFRRSLACFLSLLAQAQTGYSAACSSSPTSRPFTAQSRLSSSRRSATLTLTCTQLRRFGASPSAFSARGPCA